MVTANGPIQYDREPFHKLVVPWLLDDAATASLLAKLNEKLPPPVLLDIWIDPETSIVWQQSKFTSHDPCKTEFGDQWIAPAAFDLTEAYPRLKTSNLRYFDPQAIYWAGGWLGADYATFNMQNGQVSSAPSNTKLLTRSFRPFALRCRAPI